MKGQKVKEGGEAIEAGGRSSMIGRKLVAELEGGATQEEDVHDHY